MQTDLPLLLRACRVRASVRSYMISMLAISITWVQEEQGYHNNSFRTLKYKKAFESYSVHVIMPAYASEVYGTVYIAGNQLENSDFCEYKFRLTSLLACTALHALR